MITKTNKVKCDICGKFISYKDLEKGRAYHVLLIPDNHFSGEICSSECRKCYESAVEEQVKNELSLID